MRNPASAEVTPVPSDRELYHYRGPTLEFEFYASNATERGSPIERAGELVQSIDLGALQWAGERGGDHVSDEDRLAMAGALADYYRGLGIPYHLLHLSGEIEDETGRRRPGFRGVLGRFNHSDGWALVDLFMSPEFPDASAYPPTIEYRDAQGAAEMSRWIEVADGVRQRVLVPNSLRWTGDRSGTVMSDIDRTAILDRIRSIYDYQGTPYRLDWTVRAT
jgi:hypothetical protein